MSHFAFQQIEWLAVLDAAVKAERIVRVDPRSACFYARRAGACIGLGLRLRSRAEEALPGLPLRTRATGLRNPLLGRTRAGA